MAWASARLSTCVRFIPVHNATGKQMPATTTLHTETTDKAPILLDDSGHTSTEPGYRVIRRNGAVTPFDPMKCQ